MSEHRLRVWTTEGDIFWVVADEEPRINAAVERWIKEGVDALVTMEPLEQLGAMVTCRASVIYGWYQSTAASQKRVVELSLEDEATNKEVVEEFGDPEWL